MAIPRVKICGITRIEDGIAAVRSGADAIGLVFYPYSSRYIENLDLARKIALSVGPFVTVVGLFVNAHHEQIEQILRKVPIQLLQFHGSESEEQCCAFTRPYIKAVRMRDETDLNAVFSRYVSAVGFLLDTYVKGSPGGTGKTFDWRRVPDTESKPLILAGGLNPDNVHHAVATAHPYGVDVSGGVESAPGIKDEDKMKTFINRAKREP